MKIFYQFISDAPKLLNEQNSTLEELFLPNSILEELISALKHSTELLPLSARSFKEWSIGLLDRFQNDHALSLDGDAQFKPLFT